jgi:hypothetical protein
VSVLLTRGYIGLAMVDAKGCGGWRIGIGEADIDRMEFRVVGGRNEA